MKIQLQNAVVCDGVPASGDFAVRDGIPASGSACAGMTTLRGQCSYWYIFYENFNTKG